MEAVSEANTLAIDLVRNDTNNSAVRNDEQAPGSATDGANTQIGMAVFPPAPVTDILGGVSELCLCSLLTTFSAKFLAQILVAIVAVPFTSVSTGFPSFLALVCSAIQI